MATLLPSEALSHRFTLPNQGTLEEQSIDRDQGKENTIARSYHAIQLEGFGLLLPSATVNEIVEHVECCELPGTSIALLGMANVRGNIIPFFDLEYVLGQQADKNKTRYMLVVAEGENGVGVQIPKLPIKVMLAEIDKITTTPPIPSVLETFITDIFYKEEYFWFGWDTEKFFSAVGERL